MDKNKRAKVQLKEETSFQITLQDLLDFGSKAQIATMQLADNCMKFEDVNLRKMSTNISKQMGELCDQIRNAIISKQTSSEVPAKEPLDRGNNSDAKMIESAKRKKKKAIIKHLLEALEEEVADDDVDNTDVDDTEDTDVDSDDTDDTKVEQIDLSPAFASVIDGLNDSQFDEFKTQVVDSLKGAGITDPDFQTVVEDVEAAEDTDDFNYCLDAVYDYADENGIEITTENKVEDAKAEEKEVVTEAKSKVKAKKACACKKH